MKTTQLIALCLMFATVPAFAEPVLEQDGPLSPCIGARSQNSLFPASNQWAVEITTTFSKEETLNAFDRIKQEHPDILGDYEPIVVEQCNLSMGNRPQYSARVVTGSRDAADSLCSRLQESGGACLVQKN